MNRGDEEIEDPERPGDVLTQEKAMWGSLSRRPSASPGQRPPQQPKLPSLDLGLLASEKMQVCCESSPVSGLGSAAWADEHQPRVWTCPQVKAATAVSLCQLHLLCLNKPRIAKVLFLLLNSELAQELKQIYFNLRKLKGKSQKHKCWMKSCTWISAAFLLGKTAC